MAGAKAFVTDTELELLKALWNDEPLTARDLAERMYPDESASAIGTVQKLIQRLEEKELLARQNGNISLTRRGLLEVDHFLKDFFEPELRTVRYA